MPDQRGGISPTLSGTPLDYPDIKAVSYSSLPSFYYAKIHIVEE
jgi:hypothetical protein